MKSRAILNIYMIGALALGFALPVQAEMSASERDQLNRLQRDVQILKRQVDELVRAQKQSQGSPAPTAPSAASGASAPSGPGISLGSNPMLGSKDAKIALIEFSDYQCPYCARFHAKTFDRIRSKYIDSGKLAYAYRDVPSPRRPQAGKAAVAARCAGRQDKYFEMQKLLFKNATSLNDNSYTKLARKLNLDVAKFESCLISQEHFNDIKQDMVDASRLGVRGTPTFYLGTLENGRITNATRLVGALPYTTFKTAIEKQLK